MTEFAIVVDPMENVAVVTSQNRFKKRYANEGCHTVDIYPAGCSCLSCHALWPFTSRCIRKRSCIR
jgi:hypothetical protein